MMKKKKIIFTTFSVLMVTLVLGLTISVKANENECIYEISKTSDGKLDGWMLSHKIDNTNLRFFVGSKDLQNGRELTRNDNETRTHVNWEQTENETFDYDNIGVSGTSTGEDEWIWAVDENGNVTCSTKLIPINQANQVAHIAGTQCDIRDKSGNKINDFTHFQNDTNYNIVDSGSATINGVSVTIYGVQVSASSLSNLGTSATDRSYVDPATDPDDMAVVYVFDSCIQRQEGGDPLKPDDDDSLDEKDIDVLNCTQGGGDMGGSSCDFTGEDVGCGLSTTQYECGGEYTTGYQFGIKGEGLKEEIEALMKDDYECSRVQCQPADCQFSLSGKIEINFHKPEKPTDENDDRYFEGTINGVKKVGFKAGTYFDDYFIDYTRTQPQVSASGDCRSVPNCITCSRMNKEKAGSYDCRPTITCQGNSDDPEDCEDKDKGDSVSNPNYSGDDRCIKEVCGQPECTPTLADQKCEEELGKIGSDVDVKGEILYQDAVEQNKTVGEGGNEEIEADYIKKIMTGDSFKYIPRYGAKISKKTSVIEYVLGLESNGGGNEALAYPHAHFIPKNWEKTSLIIDTTLELNFKFLGQSWPVTINSKCPVDTTYFKTDEDPEPPCPPDDPDCPEPEPCSPDDPNCHDIPGDESEYIYRPIELTAPFPNREPGYNWYEAYKETTMPTRLKNTYTSENLEFSIHLNNGMIREIRSYNKQKDNDSSGYSGSDGAGYLDYSIDVYGKSIFLNELRSKYNVTDNIKRGYGLGCGPYNEDEEGCR